MKKLYLFSLIFLANFTFAQGIPTSTLDSLQVILSKKSSKERCLYFLEKAEHFSNINTNYSFQYNQLAVNEALNSNDKLLLALTYNSLGNIHQYKTDIDSALHYHKKALALRMEVGDSLGLADSYNNIGIAYDANGNFESALLYYFKSLKCSEAKKNDEKTAMTLVNIGIVYKAQKEYKKAYYYYKKANELYIKIKSDFGITVTAGNLGGILINFQSYQKSLAYSETAKEGYKKLNYNRYLAYPISNIAVVYDSLHRFTEANLNYIESISLHEKFKNNFEVANISNAFANCLIKQQNYHESIDYSLKALKYAQEDNAGFLEVGALNNLSKAYGKLGLYEKAYYYANLYNKGTDLLFKKEKTKAIFELEAKYENEKKSKLLLQIQTKMQRRNTLILILSILIASVALISYLIYRQQKIKVLQREQEFKLKTAIAEIESQNKLQEQRISISRDLHDNIGAQLTFIISSINNIKHAFDINNTKLEKKLQSISSFTKSTIVELRDTIWAMNINKVSLNDLKLRIYNFIEKAKLAIDGIRFEFEIDENLTNIYFSSVDGMNVYRVIQEAVHNSIKYSKATEISVHFKKDHDLLLIKITDNGSGFDPSTVLLGNGIFNMKKRIKDIHGTFILQSEVGKGTCVIIELPYKQFTT